MHYLLPGYPQSKIPLHIRHDFQCHYPYLVVNSDREKSVEYAKQHMAKDQRGDDWQDQCVMVKIQFTAKGVAFYRTTPADNVRPPMPMLHKLCYKDLKNDEGK